MPVSKEGIFSVNDQGGTASTKREVGSQRGKNGLTFYVKQNWKLLSPIHSCFSVRIVPELGLDPKEK